MRRTRVGILALLGTLSVPVVVAAVAWACGPSGYGTPETPAAPPTLTGQAPAVTPSAPAPTQDSAPAQPKAAVPAETGTASTPGATTLSTPGSRPTQRPSQRGTVTAPTPAAQADITARIGGSTAGVVRERGQAVFASSAAPTKPKAKKAKAAARPSERSAPAVSERSATGDLWSAVTGSNPSLAQAASAGEETGGLSGGAIAGIAALGLALVGITGGALATAGRRRRAAAGAPKQ